MLDKLGQDYPYKRERSAPGITKHRNDSKTFNIITCQDKPFTSIGGSRELPSIHNSYAQTTRPRKLGDYVDFPNPKNKKNQEALIDYNLAGNSSTKRRFPLASLASTTPVQLTATAIPAAGSTAQANPSAVSAVSAGSVSQAFNQTQLTFQQQKNLMNSSSVGYNFISYTNGSAPKTISDLRSEHNTISNRTKQIAAISDMGRLFAPNFNPEYQSFFKSNPNAFNRNKGMCADTYNRAHTYGPGLKPFRKLK